MKKSVCNLTLLVMALLLVSCASTPPGTTDTGSGAATPQSSEAASGKDQDKSSDANGPSGQTASSSEEEERGDTIRKGSGVFVQGTGTGAGNGYAEGDGVTLNSGRLACSSFSSRSSRKTISSIRV